MKRPKDLSFQKACFISEVGFNTDAYRSWLADEDHPNYMTSSAIDYQHEMILEDREFAPQEVRAIIRKLYKLAKEFKIDVIILD